VRRAHIGIEAQTVAIPRRISVAAGIGATAVRVGAVASAGPAAHGGLRCGDIITAIDREPVIGTDDFLRKLDAEKIGRPVTLQLLRSGSLQDFKVVPEERGRRAP
jgi:S1-C subfamily serine protease